MKGKVFCVGVGPGDPELLTLKAVRLIRDNEVIAVPGRTAEDSAAYRIASAAVPEMSGKELVPLFMPMTEDRGILSEAHRRCAETLKSYLAAGRDVVYLTLGDPTVYCTFAYLQPLIENDGFAVEYVSGVPSFCAAAARLGIPLAEGDEPVHVIPGVCSDEDLALPGTCVLMRTGRHMPAAKEALRRGGRDVLAAENCTMENERVFRGVEEIPDGSGYFTVVIAKERAEKDLTE
ncbi:MAG: precorrin-2 C(20)-methyltransferase [Oscillospiraceae bacterium]|nr:precorrin-2 C(20)-methyltransferase [Oscillospiraceae bacterium]